MRKQDHLILLIQSLSPSEKKYFRQYVSARQDSKSYERLFDVLSKMPAYDAESVSRTLGKSKKSLADDKEYLQEILLRSLHGYHASSMYRARCFNGLIEAELLATRGMQELALSRIRRLKKTILPGEENLYYYMVMAQETNLLKATTPGGLRAEAEVKDNSDELVDRLQSVLLYNQIVRIAIQVIDLCADITYMTSAATQKKAAAYIQQAQTLTHGKKLSSLTYYVYHKMLAEYYFFLGVDTRLAVYHVRRAMQRFEAETPEFQRFYERDHFFIYQTMVQCYFALRDFRQMQWCMQRIKELIGKISSHLVKERAQRFYYHHQIMIDTAAGRYADALTYMDEHMQYYLDLKPDEENISVIEMMRAVSLFHLQRYEESLAALLPMLASAPPAQLPETRIEVRVLNLMLQYELGNIDPLSDYIRAAGRFFRTEKLMTKEVTLFLELIQQLYRHGAKAPVVEYQKRLEDIYSNNHFELIGYFILLPWMKRLSSKTAS